MRNKITKAVPPNPVATSNLSGKLTKVSKRALFFHQIIKSQANQFADNSRTKQVPSALKQFQISNSEANSMILTQISTEFRWKSLSYRFKHKPNCWRTKQSFTDHNGGSNRKTNSVSRHYQFVLVDDLIDFILFTYFMIFIQNKKITIPFHAPSTFQGINLL